MPQRILTCGEPVQFVVRVIGDVFESISEAGQIAVRVIDKRRDAAARIGRAGQVSQWVILILRDGARRVRQGQ